MAHRWTFCGGVDEDHPHQGGQHQEVQRGVWREEGSGVYLLFIRELLHIHSSGFLCLLDCIIRHEDNHLSPTKLVIL
jgi:hypothetical protein